MKESLGKLGRTIADSEPHWPERPGAAVRRPNIVTVVFDDTGWADFGCFGSEIRTPNIDALAERGLRYTNFHVTPLCSPTRAAMFTGRNHHAVGMRCLADTDTGFPNGRGSIPRGIAMLPDMLREQGYATFLVGKWHLTPAHEVTAAGPYHNWPLARGFDRFYGFLGGCVDQYSPELTQDNHPFECDFPQDYHLSEDLCDRAITYLRDHVSLRSDDPFFLNLAFGATHAPFQVPRRYIDPYLKTFQKGWDQTREDRLERQRQSHLAGMDTVLAERNPEVPGWDTLSDEEKTLFTHLQAAYAGFLEHADEHLGRVIVELKRLGVYDNTIILVLSDNGASREGGANGSVDVNAPYSGKPQPVEQQLENLDKIGGPEGPAHYPQGWAMAGNTPFRRYKQFVELGGVRSPLVVSWPAGITDAGAIRDQFLHVIDIAPTLLDLCSVTTNAGFHGASFRATFDNPDAPPPRNLQYWEMFGRRAIFAEGWKAISSHEKGDDYDSDTWSLYDTANDFSESRNVASEHPGRLDEMIGLWWREAEANQVLPLDDRTLVDIINFRQPNGLMARPSVTLFPGQGHVPQYSMITSSERSMEIAVHFRRPLPVDAEGVILASGLCSGGYTLYMKDGRLCFEHIFLGRRDMSYCLLPVGAHRTSIVLHVSDNDSATVQFFADRKRIGRGKVTQVANHLSFWGLDVGQDCGANVSDAYSGRFPVSEQLVERVELHFLEEAAPEDIAALMEATE